MSYVFVVDHRRKSLDPIHPGRARYLLKAGHAVVLRRYPFVVMLKESRPADVPAPLRVKLDPGSKTTGIAVVNDAMGPSRLGCRSAPFRRCVNCSRGAESRE
jgi:RRXRR protein